jgi:hypothetical protein
MKPKKKKSNMIFPLGVVLGPDPEPPKIKPATLV